MASVTLMDSQLQALSTALGDKLGNRALLDRTLALVETEAPDERLALSALIKLTEQSPAAVATLLEDSAAAGLIFCLGASQATGDYLAADAPGLEAVAQVGVADYASLAAAIKLDVRGPVSRQDGPRLLKQFKRHHFVRIAMADLLGRVTVGETMRLMSQLADECIAGALAIGRALMDGRIASLSGFCVMALGKLGVCELNLSSDIDLSYIFDAADPTSQQESATRLAELVTELLAECFRVDLRLRPGGSHAPLVSSLENAINFYQNFGQTWERAALLRGRAAAGDVALGQRLLTELVPFIYRRYLDFETLGQLRTMKQMIEREFRSPGAVRSNIKLGYGGIRELEFVVQALTLVYAGRDPRLRYPQTIDALNRLQEFGYLKASRARQLVAAYLFLRDVEHKLQVVADLQTHSLPDDRAGMARLAARMGFGKDAGSAERFAAVLDQHRNLVSEVFREMLPAADQAAAVASVAAQQAFDAALDPERSAPFLLALGFAEPTESAGHLVLLARGPAHGLASPRRRELLKTLGPLLLDEISQQTNPDQALANLASCIAAIGARTSFLTLLEQHPATRRVLLGLFASSQYLSGLFIRHPDMLDVLVRSDQARLRRSALEIRAELRELLAHAPDFEDRLDALRALRHQEFLRVAIADVAGQMELSDVETELTALAESVLTTALELARQECAARFPLARDLPLCGLAMGRLGSGEMSYNSDLDLIFVYEDGDQDDAARRETAARIVQKLIAILEVRTREGYLYKCDLRLRPSGNAGPLVASLAGFRQYHRESSATWERQALIRGRVVAGDTRLGAAVERARLEFVFGHGLSGAEIAEIAAMRERIERELGQETPAMLNIKQGRGGLMEVEFLTQMMALRHGHAHPELRQRRVRDLLDALKAGNFLTVADADSLLINYEFLERLENYLRMDTDQAAWAVSTDPAELRPLARRLGFDGEDGPARLLAELDHRRSQIRQICERCFGAARDASSAA